MNSSKPGVRTAGELASPAGTWMLEELFDAEFDGHDEFLVPVLSESQAAGAPEPAEQDALVEAIALANAQREAELEAERQQMAEAAYAQGYEDGRREGEIGEAARLRNALAAMEGALADLYANEARWTGAIEENVAALATAIARQIIDRELKSDAGVVAGLVKRALTEFPLDQPVRVRINPADLAALSSHGADGEPIGGNREVSWQADPQLAPGGCVLEGRDRIVDGRVDAALERVYRRLTYSNA